MTYVRELPPEGLPGREYTLTMGEVTGTTKFFVAHEHIYLMLAMGKPGGDWPREQFFASFRASSSSPSLQPQIGSGILPAPAKDADPNRINFGCVTFSRIIADEAIREKRYRHGR